MKRMVRYFFKGLLFVVPAGITVYVCWWLFDLINTPVQVWIKGQYGDTVAGTGFVAAVLVGFVAITFIGMLSSNFLTGWFVRILDGLFDRFPLIRILHSSVKELMGAFVGDKKKFNKPVRVELIPDSGVGVIGFVTRDSMDDWGLPGEVAVYVPQSYNFAGNMLVVPRERVTPLDVPGGEVMQCIVSGGVAGKG